MKSLTLAILSISLAMIGSGSAALIGYWDFEADFNDQSGNGNHATPVGASGTVAVDTVSSAAVGGGSAAFDNGPTGGTAKLLSVNDGTGGLNVNALPAFTLSIWFLTTTLQDDRRIFSEGSTTSNTPLYNLGTGSIGTGTNQMDFYRRTPGNVVTNNHDLSTETPFGDGEWHNAVLIDASGNLELYIDGAFSRTMTYADSNMATDATSFGAILRLGDCCGFTGRLDDIGIWDEAPTNPAAFATAIAAGAAADTVPITIPEPAGALLGALTALAFGTRRRRSRAMASGPFHVA